MSERFCPNCRFWYSYKDGERGQCRRHAPRGPLQDEESEYSVALIEVLIGILQCQVRQAGLSRDDLVQGSVYLRNDIAIPYRIATGFPETYSDQWCGEFEPAPFQEAAE